MLTHVLAFLSVLLSGTSGTWVATELAKRINLFGLSDASAGSIRGAAGVMALLATALLGFANHDVQPTDLTHAGLALVAFAAAWLGSHHIHRMTQSPTDGADKTGQ